jgi:hypothetical protein
MRSRVALGLSPAAVIVVEELTVPRRMASFARATGLVEACRGGCTFTAHSLLGRPGTTVPPLAPRHGMMQGTRLSIVSRGRLRRRAQTATVTLPTGIGAPTSEDEK